MVSALTHVGKDVPSLNCNLLEANLTNAVFGAKSDFTNCMLSHAHLDGATLKECVWHNAYFSHTDLGKADIRQAKGLTDDQLHKLDLSTTKRDLHICANQAFPDDNDD